MSTPLQQDVCDVMDALDNVGELFLLAGGSTLRTKTGRDLAHTVYELMLSRCTALHKLSAELMTMAAEIDGLRSQNEQLTALVEAKEAPAKLYHNSDYDHL